MTMRQKALQTECSKCKQSLALADKRISKGNQITTCRCGAVIKYRIQWVES